MTFQWWWLLPFLLLVPLLVAVYVWSQRRRRPVAARYSSLSLIRVALPGSSRLRRHLPFGLFAAAVACLVVALARPAVVLSVPNTAVTVLLAMDVSGSMCSTDIEPSRLEVAQAAATSFVEGQGDRTRIGIVAFSGLAAMIQTPTTDKQVLIDAIDSLTTGRRTAIGSGILVGIDAIAEVDPSVARSVVPGRPGIGPVPVSEGTYAPAVIVVLTDGANNAGPQPVDAAQQAVDRGIRVYTIGFGTPEGGQFSPSCRPRFMGREPGGIGGRGGGGDPNRFRRGIDEDTLREVADLTGGTYYPAASANELMEVFSGLPTLLISEEQEVEVSVAFVALGGLLCAGGLALGRAWRPLP